MGCFIKANLKKKNFKWVNLYFPGLGEPIRLLLVDNNIPFEEKRYTKDEQEDWQKNKTKYVSFKKCVI